MGSYIGDVSRGWSRFLRCERKRGHTSEAWPGLEGCPGALALRASSGVLREGPGLFAPQDILNHVFDDVESFVSRLQKSAEAARVLEHRERGRRNRRRAAGGKGARERVLGSHGHSPMRALSLAPPLGPPTRPDSPSRPHWGPASLTMPDLSPLHLRARLPHPQRAS